LGTGGENKQQHHSIKHQMMKKQFLCKHAICMRRKEAGTMLPAARGVAIPWLTGRAKKAAGGEVSLTTG
jgi:hypothetical protein